MSETHISGLKGKYLIQDTPPSSPQGGDMYFDRNEHTLYQYDSSTSKWIGHVYTTTSTSTTSTSSSTTSTSSSTTTSTTTSTSSSTTSTSTTI